MLEVVVPMDREKLKIQIAALERLIKKDIRDKDRLIHQEALKKLKAAL